MATIRWRVPTRRSTPCARCGLPMRRIGFEIGDRGKTVFQYKCENCGHTRVKILKDAR